MNSNPDLSASNEPSVSYRSAWLVVGGYFAASAFVMLFPPVGALFGPSPVKPLFYVLGPLAFAANVHGFVFYILASIVLVPLLVLASVRNGNSQAAAVCGALVVWLLSGMFTCGC